MQCLLDFDPPKPEYWFRSFFPSKEDQRKLTDVSSTVYVGNLTFYTSEGQIYELFSSVRRVIMGINSITKTPCGFCFVEYYKRGDALAAVSYLSNTKLDNRLIRVSMDFGFTPGRQYGRGKSGGQVRDEIRSEYDVGRGGVGAQVFHGGQKRKLDLPERKDREPKNPRFREREDVEEDA